jgi:hypothetical protein
MQLKTPQSEIRQFQEVARERIEERIKSGQLPPDIAARLTQALQSGQLGRPGQHGGQSGQAAGQAGTPNTQGTQVQAQGGQTTGTRVNRRLARRPEGPPIVVHANTCQRCSSG